MKVIHKVFAVYDDKTEFYTRPFLSLTTGEAVRDFRHSANDPVHKLCIHAGDFTLFEIGSYDDETGSFDPNAKHINLGCALEHKDASRGAPVMREVM